MSRKYQPCRCKLRTSFPTLNRASSGFVDAFQATYAQARHDDTHSASVWAQLKMLQSEFCDPDAFTNPLERWMIPTLLTRYQEAMLAGHELECQAMLPEELTATAAADPIKRAEHEKAEDEAYAELEAGKQDLSEQLKTLERAKAFRRLSATRRELRRFDCRRKMPLQAYLAHKRQKLQFLSGWTTIRPSQRWFLSDSG